MRRTTRLLAILTLAGGATVAAKTLVRLRLLVAP